MRIYLFDAELQCFALPCLGIVNSLFMLKLKKERVLSRLESLYFYDSDENSDKTCGKIRIVCHFVMDYLYKSQYFVARIQMRLYRPCALSFEFIIAIKNIGFYPDSNILETRELRMKNRLWSIRIWHYLLLSIVWTMADGQFFSLSVCGNNFFVSSTA